MSDQKATPPPPDFPVDKRRGGMDTLFSAPWFDGDGAAANAPTEEVPAVVEAEPPAKKSNTMLLVVAGVVVFVLLPALLCGALGVLGGVYYYLVAAGTM